VEIAIAAFTLSQMTRVREAAVEPTPARSTAATQFAVNR
jgi:hypothetical protein